MRRSTITLLLILLVLPGPVFAAVDTDVRVKLGSAAGAQRLDFGNMVGHGSSNYGTNAQVEVILSRHQDRMARFILTMGLFSRHHQGKINDLSFPTKIDYSITGISIAPGVRVKIDDSWDFEGKIEAGGGRAGKLTLDSPGVYWNSTKKGSYESISLILGIYYLFSNTSSRVGLELGMQQFEGDFEILSNSGSWTSGHVTGRSGTANIVYGYQF